GVTAHLFEDELAHGGGLLAGDAGECRTTVGHAGVAQTLPVWLHPREVGVRIGKVLRQPPGLRLERSKVSERVRIAELAIDPGFIGLLGTGGGIYKRPEEVRIRAEMLVIEGAQCCHYNTVGFG